jgi:AraC-like DNA-binding protein
MLAGSTGTSSMGIRSVDAAIEAVSKVNCPHTLEVIGPARDLDLFLEISHTASRRVVELSYGAPVKVETVPRSFLAVQCTRGSASARQDGRSGNWHQGQTLPITADLQTQYLFDEACTIRTVRIDPQKLEALCGRLLGRPLEQPLELGLYPFSDVLDRAWHRTLSFIWSLDDAGLPFVGATKTSLEELLLTLVLDHHPHNYSDEMSDLGEAAPAVIRRAERFMRDHAEAPITVSDVAAGLGVSLRSLQAGFRQWRATTPHAFLREARLHLVRDELQRSDHDADVTTIALRHGFSHLGRFSAYYRSAFGESPSATLRRAGHRRRVKTNRENSQSSLSHDF